MIFIKRIVVAGCRDYENYDEARDFIASCTEELATEDELIFLSGACRGADRLGERYAKEHGLKIEYYPADWAKFGKFAGPERNRRMADAADLVICFWDGKSKGTKSMIGLAEKNGKPVRIKMIQL